MIDEMRVSAGSSRAAALGVFVDVFVNLDVSHQPAADGRAPSACPLPHVMARLHTPILCDLAPPHKAGPLFANARMFTPLFTARGLMFLNFVGLSSV
jgi:hypothetical protein